MKRFAACLMAITAVGAVTDLFVVAGPTAAAQDKPAPKKPDDKAPPKDDKKDAKTEAGAWMDNYEKALALAKKEKKVVMADFCGSDWCKPCQMLRTQVFDQKEFLDWAKKNVVLLEVDDPHNKKLPADVKKQNDELSAKHKIQSVPTVLFFNEKGDVVAKMEGFSQGMTPAKWIKDASDQLAKAKH